MSRDDRRNDFADDGKTPKGTMCLLIIDMINEFTFPEAPHLFPEVLSVAEQIAELKVRMKAAALPIIYINDNFGQWRSNLPQLVQQCLSERCRGRAVVQRLQPDDNDYIVLKPRHSGFYGTPLELLLTFLGARRLIITGIATDSCVLYTAADAYMRDYDLIVPRDCVTAVNAEAHGHSLHHMQTMLKANTGPSSALSVT
jgi:nicotinamidase-related amidase